MRHPSVPRFVVVLLAIAILAAGAEGIAAAAPAPAAGSPHAGQAPMGGPTTLNEYPVPGNPSFVAAGPGKQVWFTLPANNLVGSLLPGTNVVTYPLSANAEPYRIVYGGGRVWFTERAGNKIGRIDAATGVVTEFDVPTPNAKPSGIDVLPGNPDTVWFTEAAAGPGGIAVGRLVVTGTTDFLCTEFPLSPGVPVLSPEALRIQDPDDIWFTDPGTARLYLFTPALYPPDDKWAPTNTKDCWSSQPKGLSVGGNGGVWVAYQGCHGLKQLFISTIQFWDIFHLPGTTSQPYEVAAGTDTIWYSQPGADRVGGLYMWNSHSGVFGVSTVPAGSRPNGIALDGDGCLWVAESGRARLANLCRNASYLYLPILRLKSN